jgi:hypothetical protein
MVFLCAMNFPFSSDENARFDIDKKSFSVPEIEKKLRWFIYCDRKQLITSRFIIAKNDCNDKLDK